MPKKILPALVALATVIGLGLDTRADEAEVRAAADRTTDAKLKAHLMNNIDIFGKSDLPAIYIFMPNSDGSEDIQGSLLTRDFSRDPFFMQNIDREEFELKVVLRELNGDEDKDKLKEAASR
ncbi:MAG TPA: hypothetical protein VJ385_22145 [Fibrobacteria bacterium]|nr:hypothetical protein [Fibrobacteria bacterium]